MTTVATTATCIGRAPTSPSDTITLQQKHGSTRMPAPRGGRKSGEARSGRSDKKGTARPRAQRAPRAPRSPRVLPDVSDAGFAMDTPRPFRPVPEYRVESTTGLRHEVIELRAEVHRLAAEIDKLWARERGRAATPGRTARRI